jgi:hypothetical protein
MARPFKCPYCGQTTTVSKGVRKTKTMGVRRIRLCKACGRKFTPNSQQGDREREETPPPQPATADPAEKATREFYQAAEPAEALGMLFPPPDEG